ncbi:hypothetical protein EN962_10960 [Mesorhizobium sp. M7A.F.Ca.CA.001.09.2.1]|nr:hypothetical protein EN981_28890 [Mesorhizobium sp. M7A.F.Ca.CA.001.13.2.1]RUY64851.1 hypothetical protein EN965_20235 [Mesorhizobium sp. M7A.F.Ca.CA.001.05.1.1]RUY70805.1 hypothetical protein EN980_07675 [Mesorhizobium sp. M7A.F.Ca.CA.001.13.1.1]RUY78937.1 hypothetical protein EN962_10960 [Mesorhizobium sp. M7A.F.Ca.CA.001.09.2.1]RUZ06951.1 hypothetical protein EN955_13510 [Mesorhizobium sp. M7A.F.Ca.CA.001.04.2.1]RUZ17849.1 hypothetical protein EN961_22660 [Mesorhizobium sp. M7A.F.Ca.CA.0
MRTVRKGRLRPSQCLLLRPTTPAPKKQADETDKANRSPGLPRLDGIGIYGRRGLAGTNDRAPS